MDGDQLADGLVRGDRLGTVTGLLPAGDLGLMGFQLDCRPSAESRESAPARAWLSRTSQLPVSTSPAKQSLVWNAVL